MVSRIDEVENLFKTVDVELDYIASVVDSEFEKLRESNVKKEKKVPHLKPSEMLQRLSHIKSEYKHIVEEVDKIKKAEKEMMEFFHDNLATACESLKQLQMQAGLEVKSNPDELERFKDLFEADAPTSTDDCTSPNTP